jgi:hypothetical protein
MNEVSPDAVAVGEFEDVIVAGICSEWQTLRRLKKKSSLQSFANLIRRREEPTCRCQNIWLCAWPFRLCLFTLPHSHTSGFEAVTLGCIFSVAQAASNAITATSPIATRSCGGGIVCRLGLPEPDAVARTDGQSRGPQHAGQSLPEAELPARPRWSADADHDQHPLRESPTASSATRRRFCAVS